MVLHALDRDETMLGHKPFLVLSDHFTRHGIAVLRFDKRGVGKSTGIYDNATIEDFCDDVAKGVEYLKSRPEIIRNQRNNSTFSTEYHDRLDIGKNDKNTIEDNNP